jgi:hypothetical protein
MNGNVFFTLMPSHFKLKSAELLQRLVKRSVGKAEPPPSKEMAANMN